MSGGAQARKEWYHGRNCACAYCSCAVLCASFTPCLLGWCLATPSAPPTPRFYLGSSLAQFPVSLLAPLAYLLPYYALAPIRCPFWQNYLLLVALHFTCTGWSFAVSIICPRTSSQLVGVLVVLVNMMFCGANPTLSTLSDKSRLGGVLIVPSYVSFVRWAQEAFYVLEIRQYKHKYYVDPEMDIYSYSFDDLATCFEALFAIALAARVVAYLVLVKREP